MNGSHKMGLKHRLLFLGTAAVMALSSLTAEAKDCTSIVARHASVVENSWWGYKKGCAAKKDLTCLGKYIDDIEGCPRPMYHKDVVKTLLEVMQEGSTHAKILLQKEGTLDFPKQLDELVDAAKQADNEIKIWERRYTTGNISERKEARREIRSLKGYLSGVKDMAKRVHDVAIILREQPGDVRLDEEVIEGIALSRQAYNSTIQLKASLGKKDWASVYVNFTQWKKQNQSLFGQLERVYKAGLAFGTASAWKHVWTCDGKRIAVTSNFEKDWRGVCGKISEIDRIFDKKVSLKRVEGDCMPPSIVKGDIAATNTYFGTDLIETKFGTGHSHWHYSTPSSSQLYKIMKSKLTGMFGIPHTTNFRTSSWLRDGCVYRIEHGPKLDKNKWRQVLRFDFYRKRP